MDLNTLARKQESPVKSFGMIVDDETQVLRPVDDGETPLFTLKVKYIRQSDVRRIISEGTVRAVNSKRGNKKIETGGDYLNQAVMQGLVGWEGMTVAGLYALAFEGNLSDKHESEEVPFNDANKQALINNSRLPDTVNSLLSNHEAFFGAPMEDEEEAVKNSSSGRGGSSGGSPANPASQAT